MENVQKIKSYVQMELDKRLADRELYPYCSIIGYALSDTYWHVVNIGASVLMTRYPELGGYPGGSFVQAVVRNDLMEAFGRADNINQMVMKFYLELLHNFNPSRL